VVALRAGKNKSLVRRRNMRVTKRASKPTTYLRPTTAGLVRSKEEVANQCPELGFVKISKWRVDHA